MFLIGTKSSLTCHLLDPHLETLLNLMIQNVRKEAEDKVLHATTQLMSHLFKVRGPKIVVKYLPPRVWAASRGGCRPSWRTRLWPRCWSSSHFAR